MRASVLLVVGLPAVALSACDSVLGISDRPYEQAAASAEGGGWDAGAAGASSSGGTKTGPTSSSGGSSGGSPAGGASSDDAGDAGQGLIDSGFEPTPCSSPGATQCTTEGVQKCTNGYWTPPTACEAPNIVCVNGMCLACNPGAAQCSSNTPQTCSDAGDWVSGTACSGSTPVCTNGICGSWRVTGGLRGIGPTSTADAGIHLVAGGFELGTRTCGDAGLCVTGGIVP